MTLKSISTAVAVTVLTLAPTMAHANWWSWFRPRPTSPTTPTTPVASVPEIDTSTALLAAAAIAATLAFVWERSRRRA